MISHIHYDHADADQDVNCMLGIHRMPELAAGGVIGEPAARYYSFMGFVPDPTPLMQETGPAVAAALVEDGVDVVLLTPG
jgi:hypothetical protein